MINPRSINIICTYNDVIDQDICYNNAIAKLIDNKTLNLSEIPALEAEVELQRLNTRLCEASNACATGTEWNRYKSLLVAADNKLKLAQSYVADADVILRAININVDDLHNSVAYKNAIKNGAIPPKPADQTIKQPVPPTDNLQRNIIIGIGIVVFIALIVFISKRVSINKN